MMMTNWRSHLLAIIAMKKDHIWGVLWLISITIVLITTVLPAISYWNELNLLSIKHASSALPYFESDVDLDASSNSLSDFDFSYLLHTLGTQADKFNLALHQIDARGVKLLNEEVLNQLGIVEYSVIIHVVGEYNSILTWQSEIYDAIKTLRFANWQLQQQQDGLLSFKATINFWSREVTNPKQYVHDKPFQVRENPFTAP